MLDVVELKYFLPNELEEDMDTVVEELPNGDYNYIEALYSNVSISPTPDGTEDPYQIVKHNFPK